MRDSTNVPGSEQETREALSPARVPASIGLGPASGGNQTSNSGLPVHVTVVVPLCNEADNVLPLARRILASLDEVTSTLELIFVDDGSTDGTWGQILATRKEDPRVRALQHARRSGQSAALWSGFLAARGAIICTLDGDLQNDPADLPRMIALLKECDLVCGVRTNRKDGRLRKVSARVARWARKTVLGVDFQDTGCNLRAFKRPVLQKVFPFDGLHRFMPILAHVSGAVVREVPVSHQPRHAGRSKYGVWNRLGRGVFDLAVITWYSKRQINTVEVHEFRAENQASAGSAAGRP